MKGKILTPYKTDLFKSRKDPLGKDFKNYLNFYREENFFNPDPRKNIPYINNLSAALKEVDKNFNNPEQSTYNKRITENVRKELFKIGEIPFYGNSPTSVLKFAVEVSKGGKHFTKNSIGQMHNWGQKVAFGAGTIAKYNNENTIVRDVSPIATYMEKQVISWLAEAFGYKPDFSWKNSQKTKVNFDEVSSGNIASCGTNANKEALFVARNKIFPDAVDKGFDGRNSIIIASEQVHYSIEKSCKEMGIGGENLKKAKTINLKMMANDRREGSLKDLMWKNAYQGKKIIGVVPTFGTTEAGALDDIEGSIRLVDEFEKEFGYRPHIHVDAAHGGGFVFHPRFDPKKGGLLKGIERADSITFDPHKMFYTPYEVGCVIFKRKSDHKKLFKKVNADYLFNDEEDYINIGPDRLEGSMGTEGVQQFWANLVGMGKLGLQVIQENTLRMADYLYEKIKSEENFQAMHKPEIDILCFRYHNKNLDERINDVINKEAQKILYERGKGYISHDKLFFRENEDDEGRKIDVFRSVIMNPHTDEEVIDRVIKEVKFGVNKTLRNINLATSKFLV
jgi:L-2,4-diaminobutyrate decarboxylase